MKIDNVRTGMLRLIAAEGCAPPGPAGHGRAAPTLQRYFYAWQAERLWERVNFLLVQ